MRLRWTGDAINDLVSLRRYIEKDKPGAARDMVLKITDAVTNLQDQLHIGRPGRVPYTREFVVPGTPYIIPYRVKRDIVEVLRVIHGTIEWPESFD